MRTAFLETLVRLARHDERIWLLTGDLGYSVLEGFAREFPERFVNAGVAEQNLTGVAAGLALSGKIVFTYSIANFPTLRCLEQIRNDVCYHRANVKVVAVGGGLAYGSQGYTHFGVEDLAVMRALPYMTVVAPGDPVEARLATEAIAQALVHHKRLRVITNNLNVATILSTNEKFEVIVAGGLVRHRDGGLIGEATIDFIQQFRVDVGIIGISGIDLDGTLLDFDYREVRAARAIIDNSRKVFLATDHTKFGRNAMVRLGNIDEIDSLFTDRMPPSGLVDVLTKAEVKLFVAQ
jgi:hypothetical protein